MMPRTRISNPNRCSTPRSTTAVLTALSIVIAGTGAYYGISVELHNVDQRVAEIETTLQQLANVVVMTARQDERLIAIECRVDRLEQAAGRSRYRATVKLAGPGLAVPMG